MEIIKINIQTSIFQNNHYCTSLTTFTTIPLLVFLQISFNLYSIYIVVLPACISMHHMYVWHARKPKRSVSSSQSYRWLWVTKWMPGTKLKSYERTNKCSSLLSHLPKPSFFAFVYLHLYLGLQWLSEIHHVDPLDPMWWFMGLMVPHKVNSLIKSPSTIVLAWEGVLPILLSLLKSLR